MFAGPLGLQLCCRRQGREILSTFSGMRRFDLRWWSG
jgi:hypothetical protein